MRIWENTRVRRRFARRFALAGTGLVLVAGMLPVVGGVVASSTGVALADDITASLNLQRTGWDNAEPNMSPATVGTFAPGGRWNITLPDGGAVYAQPLVLGSTVIVATEKDDVYGVNAGTGALEWSASLGTPVDITQEPVFNHCLDLRPYIGVTGTPAYDSNTGHIFMFADELVAGKPAYFMIDMAPAAGSWANATPTFTQVPIAGGASNDPKVPFLAEFQMERTGVLVTGGAVYGAFASHCDTKPWGGYVARVNIVTHHMTLWSDESGSTYNCAGIWQSGGGIMTDPSEPGSIYVTSGNGVSPIKRKGSSPGGQLAESVIRLVVNSNGTLSAKDFFSPANAPTLDAGDTDYGSAGPVAVSNFTVAGYHLVAQEGKDGRIWLLNTQNLGGREQAANNKDASLFVSRPYGGIWGHPAIFGDTKLIAGTPVANDFLVSVGSGNVMRLFRFDVKAHKPWLSYVAGNTLHYGYASGSPVITSSGSDPNSAVIWEVFAPQGGAHPSGVGSELEAYTFGKAIAPSSCSSTSPCTLPTIWHSDTFTGAKFTIPAISQGWVYVGTRDGHVIAFAAPSAVAPAAIKTVALASTAVGSTTTQPVAVTATRKLTITGAPTTSGGVGITDVPGNEFSAGQVSVVHSGTTPVPVTTYPVTLHRGDKLVVQTSFTPVVPGGATGTLSLSTSSSAFPTVNVPLTAEGTKEGLYAQTTDWPRDPGPPGTQMFPAAPDQAVLQVPVGIKIPETVNISNLGKVAQTVTSVTPPSGQFSAIDLPAVGTKIVPGESLAVQVTYVPTSTGPATGSFTIVGSSGQKAVVTLSGIAVAAVSQFTASVTTPAGTLAPHASASHTVTTANFGSVKVGTRATEYIYFDNSGNTQSLLAGTSNLSAPFATPLRPAIGLPFNPDSDLRVPVTFTPTRTGTFSTNFKIHWTDVNGTHTLVVSVSGAGV